MKAIVINSYGETDQRVFRSVPRPSPEADEILIRVRAFGINRAEIYMRQGSWGDVAKISGIECVGEVAQDPTGHFAEGQTVAALMGGMGRTRNGSYAEFTCVPSTNVVQLDTVLSWTDLAAIPESYATAWSCLHDNMRLKPGDTIFIRGGTSALGQAAINIAAATPDVTVLSTTRHPDNISLLKSIGSADVLIDCKDLTSQLREKYPHGVDGVMDIVGNTTLLDSLKMVRKNGCVCNAGFIGGSEPIQFSPLTDMPSGVNLSFFASFMFGTACFPLSNIPWP